MASKGYAKGIVVRLTPFRNKMRTRDNLVRRRVIQEAANVCTGGCGSEVQYFRHVAVAHLELVRYIHIDPCELQDTQFSDTAMLAFLSCI